MDQHIYFLSLRCRVCGLRLDRGYQKTKQTVLSYALTDELKHGQKCVHFNDVLRDLRQFAIDTFHDDSSIHPKRFCKACYDKIRACILDPSAITAINFFKFEPHVDDVKECAICKLHSNIKPAGRPRKVKRGRRKNEPEPAVGVCDVASSISVMHAYAQPMDVEPSPNIRLAREILLAKKEKGSSSIDEPSPSCSSSAITTYTPLSSPVEAFTPVVSRVEVENNTPKVGTSTETASGVVVAGLVDCNLASTPRLPRKGRGPGVKKTPMADLASNHSRNRRLQPIAQSIKNAFEKQNESVEDLWPFLTQYFGLDKKSKFSLSALHSLAFKITGHFNDNQYKFIYLNAQKQSKLLGSPNLYASLHSVKLAEVQVKPGFAKFELFPPDNVVFPSENHLDSSERCAPIDMMANISKRLCTLPPNLVGTRYRYDKAIAQTLSEYQDVVDESLDKISEENTALSAAIQNGVTLDACFKDGADGLGEISQYKGKTLRVLPNNAMRYAFTLMYISLNINGETHVLHRNETPNSVKSCRTLMNAIADENDSVSSAMCIMPIEREKRVLQGKVLKFVDGCWPHSYRINIYTTMVDEKFERHYRGLEPSSSNHSCTICTYNKAQDKDLLEKVPDQMRRTTIETELQALSLKDNQDRKLSRVEKDAASKGVRALPLVTFATTTNESSAIMDATHADINVSGNMFKTIYVREIAGVYEWSETLATREKLKEATAQFDALVLRFIGNPKKLMQGGNYGKDMINFDNIVKILREAQVAEDRIQAVKVALELYNRLRRVWRATFPEETCFEDLRDYEATARKLGQHFRDKFSYYQKWTPYFHKILAHGKEAVFSTPLKTCGGLASEASEARNKNFRKDRVLHSRPNLLYELGDNLRWSWLTSSFLLQKLGQLDTKLHKCSICGKEGHDRRTCSFSTAFTFSAPGDEASAEFNSADEEVELSSADEASL